MAKTHGCGSGPTDRIHVARTGQKSPPQTSPSPGTASLLAQLGEHATVRFARHLAVLELVPAHAGIFKILAGTPGMSQCALARTLGTLPSRMVGYLDELERKGLLERRPHRSDRRNHALHLTKAGQSAYHSTARLAQEHQQALLAGLSKKQQVQLAELLQLMANQQGLISGPVLHISKRSGKNLARPLPQAQPTKGSELHSMRQRRVRLDGSS
jgi:DNA-binding MarR family transcriptional regulator